MYFGCTPHDVVRQNISSDSFDSEMYAGHLQKKCFADSITPHLTQESSLVTPMV